MAIHRMRNVTRDYAWGSRELLAELQHRPPADGPEAEVWMGAHRSAPSVVSVDGGEAPLDELIRSDPERWLGPAAEGFSKLPYLMKLLAAGQPLSLQAHPSKSRAESGWDRENAAGVPLDAPHRSYKDDNHKPELICALTPFRALAGFRDVDESLELLHGLGCPALDPVVGVLDSRPSPGDLTELLRWILSLDSEAGARLARAVGGAVQVDGPNMAERSVGRFIASTFPGDPGIVTALLLNLVTLEPGAAIYLGAGLLHAYVDGLGVEIMAASDNVLRGGLTPKHVDVDELCAVVEPHPGPVEVLNGQVADGWRRYVTPAPEFELSRVELSDDALDHISEGPEILLAIGDATVESGRHTASPASASLELGPGESCFVEPGTSVRMSGVGTLFRAAVNA